MAIEPIIVGGRFQLTTFDAILSAATIAGASDVRFISGVPAFVDHHGLLTPITDRAITQEELLSVVKDRIVYGPQAEAELSNGDPLNFPYQIRVSRGSTVRFRCNVTAAAPAGEARGIHITIRTITDKIPTLSELGALPDELLAALWPSQGMVLITGETGSGKTTLAASLIQDYGNKPEANRTLVSLEDPIEYVHPVIGKGGSLIVVQHQVRRHVRSFPDGVVNAMRQKPHTIFVGEMRDQETIRAGVTAALTGHHMISTAHTNSVSATVRRLVGIFPGEEQMMMQADIVASLRAIITQRLVPTVDGYRVPIREPLVFDESMRSILLASNPTDIGRVTAQLVVKYGRPMIEDIEQLRAEKRISDFTYKQLLPAYGNAYTAE
jgi:defect-in-organelle-trafficking protein DotB